MAELKVDKTLDVRGLFCPIPVFKAKQTIQQMAKGEVLEILATDETTKVDIPNWAKKAGHELLSMEQEGQIIKFYIRRS